MEDEGDIIVIELITHGNGQALIREKWDRLRSEGKSPEIEFQVEPVFPDRYPHRPPQTPDRTKGS
jgi:hypothetical protein